MTREECDRLIDAYISWLRKGLTVESLENACELTTPFLDRHNDHLQIYATKRNGKIELTDDGFILADLRTSGLEVTTPKRRAVLEAVLNGFGVHTERDRLVIEASQRNLGQRVHSLVQAMLAVNDMFVMAQPRVETLFWEDVRDFFDENDVRYNPRVKLAGRTGFDHSVDFLIPKSRTRSERLVHAINRPNRNSISSSLFSTSDIREVRGEDCEAYAFLNDDGRDIGGDILEALESYNVVATLWSKRHDYVAALVA